MILQKDIGIIIYECFHEQSNLFFCLVFFDYIYLNNKLIYKSLIRHILFSFVFSLVLKNSNQSKIDVFDAILTFLYSLEFQTFTLFYRCHIRNINILIILFFPDDIFCFNFCLRYIPLQIFFLVLMMKKINSSTFVPFLL